MPELTSRQLGVWAVLCADGQVHNDMSMIHATRVVFTSEEIAGNIATHVDSKECGPHVVKELRCEE